MITKETLNYFPTPYPEEDIRSILYRYHMRSLNRNYEDTKVELFGYRSTRNTAIPRRIKNLIMQLPSDCGISGDSLLKNHTLFPLVQPFLNANKEKQIYDEIYTGHEQQGSVKSRLIINQISQSINYCPVCIRHDYKKYGEVYVHRVHQIKFVMYCTTHKAKLLNVCPKCKKALATSDATKLLCTPYCDCGNDLSSSIESLITTEHGCINSQFQTIEWLIKSPHGLNRDEVQKYLYESAWNRGFYKYNGKLNYDIIFRAISEYFTSSYFESFNHYPSYFSKQLISFIFLSKCEFNHIFAVISFLTMFQISNTLEQNVIPMANVLPFGVGPWKCINHNCSNNDRSMIKRFHKLNTRSKVFRAYFKCDECGMIYRKTWDWNEVRYGENFIVTKGIKRKIEIVKLFISGERPRDIAAMTNCSVADVKTELFQQLGSSSLSKRVNKEIDIESAAHYAKEIVEGNLEAAAAKENNKIIMHRKQIKKCMQLNSNITRKELQKKCRGSYCYLLMHDKDWMQQKLPKKTQVNKINEIELDDYLFQKVESAYKSLSQISYPRQIKEGSILRMLESCDRSRYFSHKRRLPKTTELLEYLTEPKEEFLVRNIPNIYNQLKANGIQNVTLKSISSYRRSYRNISEITKERIEAVLRELQINNK